MKIRLKDAFDLQMGKTPARNTPSYWDGDHKWISIADIGSAGKYIATTKERITDKAITESGIRAVPAHTVIMSFKLSIGKTAITSEEMYTNEAIMAFVSNGTYDIDTDYLYHLCCGTEWTEGTNKAVMGLTLNKATLSKKRISLPEITEQKNIAAKFDALDNVIEKTQAELYSLDQLVKSRFVEMFGDIILNPFNWEKEQLGMVCDVRDGTHDSPQYYETGYPLVTSKNVTGGKIDLTDCSLICEVDFKKINERSKVDIGDIIMPMIGTVGKPVIVDVEPNFAIKNVSLIKFKDHSTVLNIFICALLQSDYFDNAVLSKARGGTQKFISLGDIRKLAVIIPPMALQEQFAVFVAEVDKSKFRIQKSLSTSRKLWTLARIDAIMSMDFSTQRSL